MLSVLQNVLHGSSAVSNVLVSMCSSQQPSQMTDRISRLVQHILTQHKYVLVCRRHLPIDHRPGLQNILR